MDCVHFINGGMVQLKMMDQLPLKHSLIQKKKTRKKKKKKKNKKKTTHKQQLKKITKPPPYPPPPPPPHTRLFQLSVSKCGI